MTKPGLTKLFLIALIALVGLSLAVAAINKRRKQQLVWHPATVSRDSDVNDLRPLKDKAKEKGRFVGSQPQSNARVKDLAELANGSALIIIGVPQTNISHMSADGRSISLDYFVKIEYVYKGKKREGDNVTVRLPGGMVSFDDGTVAEIRTPWFKKMQDGKTYLLFLEKAELGEAYVTTAGPEGVFEIPTDGASSEVKVHVTGQDDPVWKYDSTDVRQFLRQVRQATKTNDLKK